jgi:hypothetical protein
MATTYEPIATYTVPSSQAAYTFSSIPSTYTDLVLVASIKYVLAGEFSKLTFNGDTATNYSSTYIIGNGSAASSGRASNAAYIGTSYDANTETFTDIFNIQNYANTTTFKTVLNRHSVAGTRVEALVGLWRKTPEAITSLTMTSSGNYATGTTFTLYGIKAA